MGNGLARNGRKHSASAGLLTLARGGRREESLLRVGWERAVTEMVTHVRCEPPPPEPLPPRD